MKKSRRMLSFFLAMVMLLTTVSVTLMATAAEKDAVVSSFEESILALEIDNLNTTDIDLENYPERVEARARYENIIATYQTFSPEQEESISWEAMDTFLFSVVSHLRYRNYLVDNPTGSGSVNGTAATSARYVVANAAFLNTIASEWLKAKLAEVEFLYDVFNTAVGTATITRPDGTTIANPRIFTYTNSSGNTVNGLLSTTGSELASVVVSDPAVTATNIASAKAAYQNVLSIFTDASPFARAFFGVYYASYDGYGSSTYRYTGKAGVAFMTNLVSLTRNLSYLEETGETAPTAPSASAYKYPGGTVALRQASAEYLADYAAWEAAGSVGTAPGPNDYKYPGASTTDRQTSDEFKADYAVYAAKQASLQNRYLPCLKEISDAMPGSEYEGVVAFFEMAISAYAAYAADSSVLQPSLDAASFYETLTPLQQYILASATSQYAYVYPNENGYAMVSRNAAQITSQTVEKKGYVYIGEFVEMIESVWDSYTQQDIRDAVALYAKIPTSLRSDTALTAEIIAKFNEMKAAIGPEMNVSEADLTQFVQTQVEYSVISKDRVEKLLGELDPMISDLLGGLVGEGGLGELLGSSLYTNAMVGTLITFIYPLLGDLSLLISRTPVQLASALTEDKFAGARAVLLAVPQLPDTTYDWSQLSTFASGDWGFEDGDREGFLDAIAAIMRPFYIGLGIGSALTLQNKWNTTAGTYTYGAYEYLVPLLEALGVPNVMSSHDYSVQYNAASAISKNDGTDALFRPIFAQVFDFVDALVAGLEEDPLDTLVDVLVKLAYLLENDIISEQVNKILGSISLVTIDPISLGTETIIDLLNGLLGGIELAPAVTDEQGNEITPAVTLSLVLSAERFAEMASDLAYCGAAVAVPSVARAQATTLGIEVDRADAFMVFWRYLVAELQDPETENFALIGTLLTSLDLGLDEGLVSMLLPILQTMPADNILAVVATLLLGVQPSGPIPEAPERPKEVNVSSGSSTTTPADPTDPADPSDTAAGGDDSEIPQTGDTMLLGIAAIASLATAATFLARKKKREDVCA